MFFNSIDTKRRLEVPAEKHKVLYIQFGWQGMGTSNAF
jgi:hypothetical protein